MYNEKEVLLIKDLKRWQNMSKEQKEIQELKKKKIQEEENTPLENCKTAQEELERCFTNCFLKNGYEKSKNYLYSYNNRLDIVNHIAENSIEYAYLKDNYDKILNKIARAFKNDFEAQKKDVTFRLKRAIMTSNTLEIAKKIGYNQNKKYTLEEVNELTRIANKQIELIKQQEEQQKKENKKNTLLAIFKLIGLMIKWTCYIFFGIFYIIYKVLTGLAKAI